jgi:hypothetical protein
LGTTKSQKANTHPDPPTKEKKLGPFRYMLAQFKYNFRDLSPQTSIFGAFYPNIPIALV